MSMFTRRRFLATTAATALLPRFSFAAEPQTDGINAFAGDLYGQLRTKDGNQFLSPYSISTALAMTAAGAKGATLTQMQKVLHLPADAAASDAAYEKVAKGLTGTGKGFELAVANALWAQNGYPWSNEYKTRVTKAFQAGIHDTNYGEPEKARKTINTWVEQQTKDKIKDLMPEGSITVDTRLVLTNAIYFKGDWLTPFEKDATQDLPFTKLDGSKKNVPLMHRSGYIDYFANDEVQMVRMPYKGKEISFIGVLPKNPEKFGDLDAKLTGENVAAWAKQLAPRRDVKVWLPRFKVETTYRLNEPLAALGMTDAFEPKADFSGMVTSPERLMISLVIHKAFVDVNEKGTEAAAATGVAVALKSAMPAPEEPKIFRADRPFLFALRHEPTGTLLFLGRYTTP